MKKLTAALFLLGISISSIQAQSVDEILANYFENTGGIKKWEKMETVVMKGSAPSPQGDFPFTVYNKKPNMMKIEVDIQGKKLIPQAYDGETAWGLNPFAGGTSAQKVPEDLAWTVEEEAEFEPVYINYKEKGHEITLEGEETIDGAETYKLKVVKNKNNDKQEIVEYHFFDKENFVPIMVRSSVLAGPAKGMESETYLSDYQETDYGVIMPYYIETRSNGQVGQKIVVQEIVINSELDDSLFAYPEPVEEAPVEEAPVEEAPVQKSDGGNG